MGIRNSSTSTDGWKFQILNLKKKMSRIGHRGIILLTILIFSNLFKIDNLILVDRINKKMISKLINLKEVVDLILHKKKKWILLNLTVMMHIFLFANNFK